MIISNAEGKSMNIKFTKMHGCGNDYVYVNGISQEIQADIKPDMVRALSDRHFGIGGDGVIFINSSDIADFEMEMWNADGTRAEMCGNGIRCVAKYVYDYGLTDKDVVDICSFDKVKHIILTIKDGKAVEARVDMGEPILVPSEIPTTAIGVDKVIKYPIDVNGQVVDVTCVSMGNPHAIVYVDNVEDLEIEKIGPFIENHSFFPKRTNVEFVQNIDKNHISMRVWERGTGETLACGTGCCALTVAGVLNGLTDREVDIKVLGGTIHVKWDEADNHVYMTGPATTVFDGEIEY